VNAVKVEVRHVLEQDVSRFDQSTRIDSMRASRFGASRRTPQHADGLYGVHNHRHDEM